MVRKNDSIGKTMEEESNYKYQCKCGTKNVIYPFEHKEYKICRHCGNKVYVDPEEQKKYDEEQKKYDFIKNLKKVMSL